MWFKLNTPPSKGTRCSLPHILPLSFSSKGTHSQATIFNYSMNSSGFFKKNFNNNEKAFYFKYSSVYTSSPNS